MSKTDIMVVEDSGIVLLDIQKSLKSLGYTVAATASSKEEAMQKADEVRPDLVLMDIRLGEEMGGIEAADYIREHFDIPIVFLTGYADEDTFQRAKITDPFGYILKPFDPKGLRTTIEIALHNHDLKSKLRESEERYRTLVETMNDGVNQVDAEGKIIFVNEKFCKMTGLTKDELIGRNHIDIFPKDQRELQQEEFEERVKGKANSFETALVGEDGVDTPVILSGSPVVDHNGKFIGSIGVFTDITDRKQSERALIASEEKYRKLFSEMSAGCALHEIVCDENGQAIDYITLEVNEAYKKILGMRAEDVIGSKASAILPDSELRQWLDTFGPVALTGKSTRYEIFSPMNDRYFEGSAYSPETGKFAVTFVDVTERKQHEAALQKSEYLLRESQKLARIGHYDLNILTGLWESSESLNELFGIDWDFKTDVEGWLAVVHPDDREMMAAYFVDEVLGEFQNFDKEYRIARIDDGETRWVHGLGMLEFDNENNPIRMIGSIQDITERRQAEEKIRESESRLSAVIENTSDISLSVDLEYRILTINETGKSEFKDRLNIDVEVGQNILEMVPETLGKKWKERYDRAFAGERFVLEDEDEYAEGEYYSEVSFNPIWSGSEVTGVSVFSRNITDRKKAERELRASEERYRAVVENQTEFIVRWRPDGTRTFVNEAYLRFYNLSPNEALSSGFLMLIAEEDRDMIEAKMARLRSGEVQVETDVHRVIKPDGSIGWQEWTDQAIHDEQGTIVEFQSVGRDITEQKQAELAREESERRFREALENIQLVAVTLDIDGNVTFCNDFLLDMTGWKREELLGKNWFETVIPSDVGPTVQEVFERSIEREDIPPHFENEIETRSGERRLVVWNNTILRDIQGRAIGATSIGEDITERKKAEQALLAKTGELEALFSISTHLRKAQSQVEMLPVVLDEMRRVLHTDANTVLLLEDDQENFIFALADGPLKPNTGERFTVENSISGLIRNTGQPYKTNDFSVDQNKTQTLIGAENIGPALLAPIHSETEFLGVLLGARDKANPEREFSSSDLQLLTAIGEMVGNAMRRARLYDEALTRLQHVQALHSIDMAISANMDLHIILDVLIAQGISQLGVDATCILLLDQSTHTLEFAAGSGFRTNAIESTRVRLGEGLPGQAALRRQLVLISDISSSDLPQREYLRDEGYLSYQAAPLVSKGQLLGVLETFCRKKGALPEEKVEFLETLATQAAIAIDNAQLFSHLQRSNFEMELAYDATIEGWSRALELRDQETEGHTLRVTEMTLRLARAMGIGGEDIVQIRRGALLHDIGKMGVPDSILLKEGKLTPEEWEQMKKHSDYAFEMLWSVHFLRDSLDIPHYHHEKWDGTGYPRGLKGEEIPLSARIFAIADVWDALTSDRPYRKAWSREKSLEYIRDNAGKHFDPQVVEKFLALIREDEQD